MRKKTSLFLSFALMAALLAGCSGGQGGSPAAISENSPTEGAEVVSASQQEEAPAADSGEITHLTMTGWYDEPNMEKIMVALNEELAAENIEVEYTFVNLQQYNNVLSTQLAAGEGADIICDGASFPARIKAGNVVEITGEAYLDNFNEAGLGLCSVDGKVYGVPSYGWFSGMWYNKDIFEAKGIEPPNTFDELVAACGKLFEAGVKPLAFGLSDGDSAWHSLVGYLENDFYHGNGPGTAFDEQFAMGETKMAGTINEYITKWSVLIEKGYINSTMLGISNEQAVSEFVAGNAAMLNGGPWQYDSIKEAGFGFGMISHLGSNPNDKWLVGGPAVSYGINVNSKNQDAAKKALAAFASQNVQQAILDSNPGAFCYYKGLTPDIPAEYELIMQPLSNGNVGVCWDRWGVNMPAQTQIDESIKQLQGVIAGSTTIDQFVDALDAKADSIRYND